MLAGVAVAMTDTPGQHALGVDLGGAAALVPPGDVDALASAFGQWAEDPAALDARSGPPGSRGAALALGASAGARVLLDSCIVRCPDVRIVITADPYLPVPPLYGGIERIIDLLVAARPSAATTSR